MKFPDFTGPDIAVAFRQLLNWCRSTRILGINGIPAKQGPNGSWLTIDIPNPTFRNIDTLPPLWPTLVIGGTAESPTYKVKLTAGYVNERIPGDSESLTVNEIKDLKWGGDAPEGKTADDPREFDISVGDQVSVVVYVDEDGQLGGSAAPTGFVAALMIETEDTESSHYAPAIGDETAGTPGVYHYKIAVLKAADADHPAPWIKKFLAGSHVDHFQELPKFKKEAGDFDIFKNYNTAEKSYKTKGISENLDDGEFSGLSITDTGDEIKFATNGGNMNLQIKQWFADSGGLISEGSVLVTLYWRRGLFIGQDEVTDTPDDLVEQTVAVIEQVS